MKKLIFSLALLVASCSTNPVKPEPVLQKLIAADSNTVFYIIADDSTESVISTSSEISVILPANIWEIIARWQDSSSVFLDTLKVFGQEWKPSL